MTGQALYDRSPVFLQNALITAYGYARARKRYGGDYGAIFAEVQSARALDAQARRDLQTTRLREILGHAAAAVPFYRKQFAGIGFEPRRAELDDLPRLPILTKQAARDNAAELRATSERPFFTVHTSGSTGTPLSIVLDKYAYRLSMALLEDHEAAHGIRRTDRRATFAGRLVQPVSDDRPPFWRHNHAEHQLLCSAYHLSDKTIPHYVRALEEFQPLELIGYPSALYQIAEYCRRNGLSIGISPKAVVTNSESLLEWQRSAIQDRFKCPVFDYYGSAESVVFAAQCTSLHYHVDSLIGVAEVLDANGLPSRADQAGRLVCTTLSNRAMPLVRYETGDVVIPLDGPCGCGRPGPIWAGIVGRVDDVLTTPEGHRVGRLDHIFKGVDGIREAQIAQTGPATVVIRVVPDGPALRPADRMRVSANLAERLGPRMTISVETVSAIPRTSRGKFRAVVNEYLPQEQSNGSSEPSTLIRDSA